MTKICSLCGKAGDLRPRPYIYDSSEITIELVCHKCQTLHSQLTEKKG